MIGMTTAEKKSAKTTSAKGSSVKKTGFQMLTRALGSMWRHEPTALVMAVFWAVCEALLPFGPMILLYLFVDGLERGLSFADLFPVTLVGVTLIFMLKAARGKLKFCIWPHIENCNELSEWEFTEKTMKLDYEQADSQEAAAMRAKIRNDYNWGCGAYFMIPQFQRLIVALIGLCISALLLWPILAEGKLWQHRSLYVFIVFAAAITCFAAWFEKNTRSAEETLRSEYDEESSRSNYLLWGGITYKEGKDIRIYQAQPLIKAALREEKEDKMVEGESRLEARAGMTDGAASGLLLGTSYLFIVLRALAGSLSAGSVVLDEPTAALAPISEYEVYSTFHKLIGEKTAVFISHRLSSCRFCDEILVLHEGELVQRGTHEELLAQEEGKYYQMWRAQAQYYEEGQG